MKSKQDWRDKFDQEFCADDTGEILDAGVPATVVKSFIATQIAEAKREVLENMPLCPSYETNKVLVYIGTLETWRNDQLKKLGGE